MSQNKPDVAALLARVDEEVRRKKEEGFYDPAEVRKVEEMAVTLSQAADDGASAELSLRHSALKDLWDPKACAVDSHRGGLAGKLVVAAKRLLHKATKPYINLVLARQTQFNDELVKLLNVLVPHHADLRFRMPHGEKRLDVLEDLARHLTGQVADTARDTRSGLKELEARLSAQEREAAGARGEIELLLARLQKIVEAQAAAGQVGGEVVEQIRAERARSRGASYVAFEDLHRGSREDIKRKQELYVEHFGGAVGEERPLLDLGCGRGEFLELARDHGLAAIGVDLNPEMVAACQKQGLNASESDAVAFLRQQPDGRFGGILMSQLIEHLPLEQLTELVNLCVAKLAGGGVLIAETINPQCLTTFSSAFYLDLTHIKPIHPEATRFLWRWAGLHEIEVLYLSPVPEDGKLEIFGESRDELAAAFNRNMTRLNQLLYGYQDYAVKGVKG